MTNDERMAKPEAQIACHTERSKAQRNAVEGPRAAMGRASRLRRRHWDFGLLSSFAIRPSSFSWQFGGWLQRFPPTLAWIILAVAALAGLALIVFLYRRTLHQLPPASRLTLTALRVALLLALLLVLANPSRVERPPRDDSKTERHLAVVVDRSASMDAVDNRNETRLKNALRLC